MRTSFNSIKTRARRLTLTLATLMMALGNTGYVGAVALNTASTALGDPRTGQSTTYTVDANGFTTGTGIACVEVVLNDQADGGGSAPAGITTTSSTLSSSSLITPASWSVDNTTAGTLRITHNTATETPAASGDIVWGAVTNGSAEGVTYYALMTTYTDAACTTPAAGVDTVVMAFIYKDGEPVQLTIEPVLTFACVSVGSGQDVQPTLDPAGDQTTVASTGTGIDHTNNVTSSTNGRSAHDLAVTTNASGGYDIFIRHTQLLTNANTDTIAAHTGTNAAPTAFPAAGTEAWGYTTDDTDLTQFAAQEYAGFTTGNEQAVTNPAANAGVETTRVGHQVGVAAVTPAGTYLTTIIYTIVATY